MRNDERLAGTGYVGSGCGGRVTVSGADPQTSELRVSREQCSGSRENSAQGLARTVLSVSR